MSEMADAIRALSEEKGVSEESIRHTIEEAIRASYKRTFGTNENCIIRFADDLSDVFVFQRKLIVEDVYEDVKEIELADALKIAENCELGDEIDIPVDPKKFSRSSISTGKQTAHQGLNESFKDTIYKEYQSKIGELMITYVQRSDQKGTYYLDCGRKGRIEGELPLKFQNPREVYDKNDRVRAVLVDIRKKSDMISLILSRTDPLLVQRVLENEVPEIQDGTVTVHKVVREPGYRTKMAVSTTKIDVDPVGACVGPKGQRIQNVIRELSGEKIDVLRYDEDPHEFIKNALSPAEVERVVILDSEKREALAIVQSSQFSLAIGKQGQNVRLANRLCDWNIDVKTVEQAAEMDIQEAADAKRYAEGLFQDIPQEEEAVEFVSQLPGVEARIGEILKANNLDDFSDFVAAIDDESIYSIEGLTREDVDAVYKIVSENVEFEEEEADDGQEEEYFCPECGAKITLDMTQCPNCGVAFEFK